MGRGRGEVGKGREGRQGREGRGRKGEGRGGWGEVCANGKRMEANGGGRKKEWMRGGQCGVTMCTVSSDDTCQTKAMQDETISMVIDTISF